MVKLFLVIIFSITSTMFFVLGALAELQKLPPAVASFLYKVAPQFADQPRFGPPHQAMFLVGIGLVLASFIAIIRAKVNPEDD